jgi:cytochrome c
MKLITLSLIAAAALVATPAMANLELAKKSNCLACHQVDTKLVGPAYRDVAKKYKGQDVEAKLVAKVKAGGVGVWGNIPMPPNSPAVKDADIQTLVKWVLAGAK